MSSVYIFPLLLQWTILYKILYMLKIYDSMDKMVESLSMNYYSKDCFDALYFLKRIESV